MNHNHIAVAPADSTDRVGESIDPKVAELMKRFVVAETTADVINSLDKGSGVHSGGYMAPEEYAPGAATGAKGKETWSVMQKKYSDTLARNLFDQVQAGNPTASFSSHEMRIPSGMSLEDARDLVVYGVTHGGKVTERPAGKITPQNMVEGDPSVLLGTGEFARPGDNQLMVLEVATGKDAEGKVVGFSVGQRPWDGRDRAFQ